MKYHDTIILAAHRGDRKRYPENTLPAFSSAIRKGVDMIETDIHMTRDGELIIMHDRSTLRTTGQEGFTNEMTYAQIRQLDAGGWFSEDFRNTKVPSVQEFIELIKDTEMLVNWELKDYPCDTGEDFAFASADKLMEVIEKNGLTERSMVNSFSNRVLEHIYKEHGHKFPIHGQGIRKCSKTKDVAATPETELFDWCCLYADILGRSPLDFGENFEYCIANGIYPCICLEDTVEIYSKALELGCRMFTSNDIVAAERILKQLNVR